MAVLAKGKGIKYMAGYNMRLRQEIKGFDADADKELFLDEVKAFERVDGRKEYHMYVFKKY